MDELISVIVPVYNVEKYLDRCVESIVAQSFTNLEIILVDDGSPDNCCAMCDAWAAKDSRIRVIHKENGGAGSARNAGLEAVHGTWFTFVDSDDYIAPQLYRRMTAHISDDVDIVECVMAETYDDSFSFSDEGTGTVTVMDPEQALSAHIADRLFRQTPPNKLYRTGAAQGILFPAGTLIDDEFWTYRVIGNARKLVHIPEALYAYRQRPGSAMHKSFSLRRLEMLDARLARLEYLRQAYPRLVHQAEISLWGSSLYSCQMAIAYLSGDERRTALERIRHVLSQIPPDPKRFASLQTVRKLWWVASRISLTGTCTVRNFLKIGI